MGNHHSHGHNETNQRRSYSETDAEPSSPTSSFIGRSGSSKKNSACLVKLFQKLELTADENNHHPGELSRTTFENAFHGPLHTFGMLLFKQMCPGTSDRERITKEEFVKSGKELLKMFDENAQHKYYFRLFAGGKEILSKEDALKMVNVCYCLTLAASSITYTKSNNDERVFESMVQGMFGPYNELGYDEFKKWTTLNCPHIFCGVHNWVYTILTGSKMPSEQETASVPELEKFEQDKYCMSMGMVWALSAVIPASYTTQEQQKDNEATGIKNPLLTSFNLLMKLARINRCQSWTSLYNSNEHGLSLNRFITHISSYHGPTITLLSFEGRNIYCVAEDTGWREGPFRFGGNDTMLLQITPVFRLVQAGGPMVMWNEYSRDVRQGIHIGKDPKSVVIMIPSEFNKLEHYGVSCGLNKIEVWGCGTTHTKQAQEQQKQWELKEAEKHRMRKLKLDQQWDENPDKQILNWGGIKVEHQFSQGGHF